MHRSGFINIIGHPNVGKSTLMNALVGERMSIITNKPQTTRHRIIGILSGEDFQMVLSDTPGVVDKPAYKMHQAMNSFVQSTFEDADLMLLVTDVLETYPAEDHLLAQLRKQQEVPMFVVLNKIDLVDEEKLAQLQQFWAEQLPQATLIPISALKKTNTDLLLNTLKENLPEGPEYYPKDQLTDRPERFFMSEIIREKIMLLYHQEIPYATQVIIEDFKEDQTVGGKAIARISATIYVERDTQKSILIGKNGVSIKKLGTDARQDMEIFLEKKVFLELFVKVKENWRNDDYFLKQFGYK
ncbi:GTPase Era [Haliscomenobacter hydrossis]|uniref:GTPase Era n=1 Tax=Haliscomenobacter hydrossis (strain ATCC 27775 / DSM 1100 / LMG 10767 / O) TaxID=760192 RepID=F4KS50_HALH1|nr:GTPase Era [Haliscomenobacter hydrossis]AEE52295.1 GTP-binding protein Era-like-protein [Haliscomenobacter hydrossis DSM 1100]